jgi:hypothetical protein
MTGMRVTTVSENGCTIAFEPWGGEYHLDASDVLRIEMNPAGGIEDIVHVNGAFIQLHFVAEPLSVVNSRGEHVSVRDVASSVLVRWSFPQYAKGLARTISEASGPQREQRENEKHAEPRERDQPTSCRRMAQGR